MVLLLERTIKNYSSIMFITSDLGNNLLNEYTLKPLYIGYIRYTQDFQT